VSNPLHTDAHELASRLLSGAGLNITRFRRSLNRTLPGRKGERSMATVIWHGTQGELARLQEAVSQHCECVGGMFGLQPTHCPAHVMLADQSGLDHLLYVYRMRKLFIRRELYALPART
jgi:hypothetical protein